MEESSNDVVEIREALMVSPLGGNPTLRIAHFLKPSLKCIKKPARDLLPNTLFSETAISKAQSLPLEVKFKGWLNPQEEWKTWEERLHSKYQNAWISAGIYEAIKASTYQIIRSNDLVLGLAQKWYSKTNTFIFSWGEATITLEDIMVCGGYSVQGAPVFGPLEGEESKGMEEKLDEVRRNLLRTKAKKASHLPWLRHFMEEKGELEHAAFLSLWLSRFVFPATISKHVFPIAINLARGTRVALAPAVLAIIYRDLKLLKRSIDDVMKLGTSKGDEDGITITLGAPFQLVQIWAFERFPALQAKPNIIEYNQPRLAKWHKVKMQKHENVSLALETAGDCFQWRPYTDSPPPKFYNEKDKWVCFNSDSLEELESFARCLRHAELVGIGSIEHYLPHRVAMQFGMDQDIPDKIAHCKETSLIAWRNYNKPMTDTEFYIANIASSTLKPNVTFQYLDWWKKSKFGRGKPSKGSKNFIISISSSEELSQASSGLVEHEGSFGPHRDQARDTDRENSSTVKELLRSHSHGSFGNEVVGNGKALSKTKSAVFPSPVAVDKNAKSKKDEVENLAESDNVVVGSRRAKEDAESEDVIGKAKRSKKDTKSAVFPSPVAADKTAESMKDGVENLAKRENVVRGSRRAKENEESEVVIGKSKRAKEDKNESNDKEGERISPCTIDIAELSEYETRIGELERVVAELKAAKFGCKFEKF